MARKDNGARILALDLGTVTGWAIGSPWNRKVLDSAIWVFQDLEHPGTRFVEFNDKLIACWEDILRNDCYLLGVVYEEYVGRFASNQAARVYGGFWAMLHVFCLEHKIPVDGVSVKTIKKYATGSGNARKRDMLTFCKQRWKKHQCFSHDEADARFLLQFVLDNQE